MTARAEIPAPPTPTLAWPEVAALVERAAAEPDQRPRAVEALARTGLRTLPLMMLDACGTLAPQAAAAARARLEQRGCDRADPALFQARAHALRDRFDPVAERIRQLGRDADWFRAADQRLLGLRPGQDDPASRLRWPSAAHASGIDAPPTCARDAALLVCCGLGDLELARSLHLAAPPDRFGYRQPIVLLEPDLDRAAMFCLEPGAAEMLEDERFTLIAGPDVLERFGDWLADRADRSLTAAFVPGTAHGASMLEPARAAVSRTQRAQRAELARARAAWRAAPRAPAARSPVLAGGPGRVLIITSRFSTFIRHAADDLARAFERRGWTPGLITEPDDCSKLSALAYTRAAREHQPDFVVSINYPRAHFDELLPPHVPVVTWVQDCLPALYSRDAAAKQQPHDALIGNLQVNLFDRLGYDPGRAELCPVVASPDKFHTGPIDPGLRRRFACEIAFVTHHAETPEAMKARLIDEAGASGRTRDMLDALGRAAIRAAGEPLRDAEFDALRTLAARTARDVYGSPQPDELATTLAQQFAMPLADRALRHQAALWAAELASEFGWRFHLYGRGWDEHPELARFARGPLEHDHQLRAAYACAAVHLHVSNHTLMHQRVFECALSGGLPVSRLVYSPIRDANIQAMHRACRRADPDGTLFPGPVPAEGYAVADHPELLRLTALRQRLGLPAEARIHYPRRYAEICRRDPLHHDFPHAAWLLGDLAELTFQSKDQLARRVREAIERPELRARRAEAIAGRVRERLTHDALIDRMLDLLRREPAARRRDPAAPGRATASAAA